MTRADGAGFGPLVVEPLDGAAQAVGEQLEAPLGRRSSYVRPRVGAWGRSTRVWMGRVSSSRRDRCCGRRSFAIGA